MSKRKSKSLTNLTIDKIELKNSVEHPPPYHPVLPRHEFSMLIVAPKGSGKTNFLCNLLLKHYKGYFHRVLVCSPTINNDEKWEVVQKTKHVLGENKKLDKALNNLQRDKKIKKVVFHDGKTLAEQQKEIEEPFDGLIPESDFFSDLAEVPKRIAEQQHVIKRLNDLKYGKQAKFLADRLLLILDDQAGMFKGGNVNNPMVNYVIKHRHVSSSVIIVTQAYKAIPKTIRTNCNCLVLFEIPNLSELKVIYEENPEGMSEKEWMRVYQHATMEPYSFLYMNNKFDKGKRVFKNFNSQLQISTTSKGSERHLATIDEEEDDEKK